MFTNLKRFNRNIPTKSKFSSNYNFFHSTISTSYKEYQNPNIGFLLNKFPELNIPQEKYNINVTSNSGNTIDNQKLEDLFRNFKGEGLPAHLYFHVPLCDYICHFCNYVKKKLPDKADARESVLKKWVELLIDESSRQLQLGPWVGKANIESFYIGGGTAAVFNINHLEKIVSHVRKHYKLMDGLEMNLEGNPDNFIHGLIDDSLRLGFNRFSLGVQSLQDEVLNFVGRKHNSDMSLQAIELLFRSNKPFNVDFMFGLPCQTVDSVTADIEKLTNMNIPTITIYRLRNADRQSMGIGNSSKWNNPKILERMYKKNLFPSTEETYKMRQSIVEIFLKKGYYPSPCGWWSKDNVYGEGNIPHVSKNKWQNYDTMLAYGPGAYGWLSGNYPDIIQTHNMTNIQKYVDFMGQSGGLPLSHGRLLSDSQSLATRLGFCFKANQPIVIAKYEEVYGIDILDQSHSVGLIINEMLEKGFLTYSNDKKSIKPTLVGEALHEEIIKVYFHDRIGDLQNEVICRRSM